MINDIQAELLAIGKARIGSASTQPVDDPDLLLAPIGPKDIEELGQMLSGMYCREHICWVCGHYIQFERCHECYERREPSDQEIISMRSATTYSEWIDVRLAMPHITVPSGHPMAATDATATASGPMAFILWKLRGSTCAIDTASEYLQARWEFPPQAGDRYVSAYADYVLNLNRSTL